MKVLCPLTMADICSELMKAFSPFDRAATCVSMHCSTTHTHTHPPPNTHTHTHTPLRLRSQQWRMPSRRRLHPGTLQRLSLQQWQLHLQQFHQSNHSVVKQWRRLSTHTHTHTGIIYNTHKHDIIKLYLINTERLLGQRRKGYVCVCVCVCVCVHS